MWHYPDIREALYLRWSGPDFSTKRIPFQGLVWMPLMWGVSFQKVLNLKAIRECSLYPCEDGS